MSRKRYAAAGVSNRNIGMFMEPILNTYRDRAELVGMLDTDRARMEGFNREHKTQIPFYAADEFDKMIAETKPDGVIVACPDAFHHEYIIRALQKNLDVISEKPMTTDEEKCAAIAKALRKSKGKLQITFNYRYGPAETRIRELVAEGRVGRVVSVDLTWYLDTFHGSSYFQRWNRLRQISGGLSIHKACHHFDLVRWWIGQRPMEAFAYGALNFYGPKGVHNPLKPKQIGDGRTCLTCDIRAKCKYYIRWYRNEHRTGETEINDEFIRPSKQYTNYSPRQCMFDPAINIEDTYAAVVRYDGGAFLTYSLNGSVPYEGYRLGINGTEGRIEYKELHGRSRLPFKDPGAMQISYIPMFGGEEKIHVVNLGGGHGGGDPLLLDEIFMGQDSQAKVARLAGLDDGVDAVLTGVAVHRSANEHKIISIEEMRKRVMGK